MVRCLLTSLLVMSSCTKAAFETHQAVGAAKVRVAALERRKAELVEKERQLRDTVRTLRAQADALETARRTVLAGAEVLAGRPVPLEFRLHQALASRADVTALANEVLTPQLCEAFAVVGPAPEENPLSTMPDDECAPAPLPDACENVPATLAPTLEFRCDRVIARGPSRAVVCQAVGSNGLPPNVVRVAYLHEGRIVAADWPSNVHDLSLPPNVDGLAQCAAENERNACVRACDVKFDLVPSGCEPFQMSGHPDDGSTEAGGDEAPPEDPAVVAAREALEAAEAEAQRAAQARDTAARALEYRECAAACTSTPPSAQERAPPLVIGFPAPGYLVLSPSADVGVESTLVGASRWLHDQPALNVVDELDTIARLTEPTVLADHGVVLAGLEAGQPTAFRLGADHAERLAATVACGLITKGPNAALKAACARGAR